MTDILVYPHEAAIVRRGNIVNCKLQQQNDSNLWSIPSSDVEKIENAAREVLAKAGEVKAPEEISANSLFGWAQKNLEYVTSTGEQGSQWKLGKDLLTIAKELKARHTNASWRDTLATYLRITMREDKTLAPWHLEFYQTRYSTEATPAPAAPSKDPDHAESVPLFSHEAQLLQHCELPFTKDTNEQGEPIFRFWGEPRSLESRATKLESEMDAPSSNGSILSQGLKVIDLDPNAEKRKEASDLRTLAREIRARRVIPNLIGQITRYNLITANRLKSGADAQFYKGDYHHVEILLGG